MKHSKGASAPFFYPVCSPRARGDALLSTALDALEAGRFGDALVAVEYVCRRFPTRSLPAILRAKIVHASRPELTARAWYSAWSRDPEHPTIQDQMLGAWLDSGAASSVAELGPNFLPARCAAGNHASLVALLARAGVTHAGACWKSGTAIDMMLFFPPAADGAPPMARVHLAGGGARHVYDVPADGRRLRLAPPALDVTWSVSVERPGQAPALLPGSPLVFEAVPLPSAPMPPGDPGRVSIVVPVYRQLALVQTCIESVLASLAHNRTPADLVVIDDASPEPALSAWLDAQAAAGRLTLLRNPDNLGFIETVNRGLRVHPGHDALLLNADTQVHGDWIDRLRAALYSAPDIASVSPWSNNGEISSFPVIARNAPAPDSAQLARLDAAAAATRRDAAGVDIEIPTCCGFAMLMRRSVIDAIGVLDGVALVRGYGEEVDWCLRARAAGHRHLLATGVFVAHTGTVSFRFEKTLRVRQNRHVLAARYPGYHAEYAAFLAGDPLAGPRAALRAALAANDHGWLAAADGALGAAAAARPVAPALPTAVARIAVWRLCAGSAAARQALELARLAAALPGRPLRLLVIGEAGEPLWHTGVVDALPPAAEDDTGPLNDAALVGFAGCTALLTDDPASAPAGIAITQLDHGFRARAWLDAWCAAHGIRSSARQ